MSYTETCHVCGETAHLSVQPPERRRPLAPADRPSMLPTTMDEWLCPNGHFRELTYSEVRRLE
jgi:hypothetical protein